MPPILTCDRPGALMTATLKLLNKSQMSLFNISRKTGVPFYWLRKFAAGRIPNPSVNRVQFLHDSLSNAKFVSK